MLRHSVVRRSPSALGVTIIAIATVAVLSGGRTSAQTPDTLPSNGWVILNEGSPWSEPPEPEMLTSVLDSISLSVSVPGFEVETAYHGGDEFQKLTFLGESFTSETGMPELPVVRMMLGIPDCDSYSLAVELGDSTDFSDARVWPVPSFAVGQQDEYEYVYEVFAIDEEFYEGDILYPDGAAVIADDGWVRDQRYLILEVHPVRYNPALSLLRCYSSVSVDIRFEDPEQTNLRGVGPFEPACRSVMANYDGVGAWTPRGGRGDPCIANIDWCSTVSECTDHGTDYLMIVEDSISDEEVIEALAEKKSWYDCLNVAIVKVSDIANPISPQAIKDFIQGVYDAGTAENVPDGHLGYVLLIGDAREAPHPDIALSHQLLPAYEINAPGAQGTDDWVPTDHWYACVYGGDYVADLAIGRLPVGDATELETEVSKIIGYEPVPLSQGWVDDIFLSCSYAIGDDDFEGHKHHVHDEELPAIRRILSDESVDIDSLHVHAYQCTSSVPPPQCQHNEYGRPGNAAAVNDSVLIMLLWGHGFHCGSLSFKSQDVQLLQNASALPFWINMSCTTGNFADTTEVCLPGPTSDCLGEYLMHWSGDGAVAFFGATKATADHSFGQRILGALYDQSYPMIGQAVAEAKMQLWAENLVSLRDLHAFNLLGDPTLNLFLGEETGYGGACDLVVRARDVVVAPELVNYGNEMTFECLVSNEGPEGTGSEAVVAFELYDPTGQLSERFTDTIDSLSGWGTATASVTWTPPSESIGAYDLLVTVDPDGLISELNEWNNTTGQPVHFYVYFYAPGFPMPLAESLPAVVPVSPVTVCDLCAADGQEVLSVYQGGRLAVTGQTGHPVWSFTGTQEMSGALCPAVADFDRDGTPEVALVALGPESSSGPREDNILVLNSETDAPLRVWKQVQVGELHSAPLVIDLDPLDGRPEVAVVGIDDQQEGSLSVWDFAPPTPALRWERSLDSGSVWKLTSPPTAVNMGLHPADIVTWDYAIDDTLVMCVSASNALKWKLSTPGVSGDRGFGVAAGDLDQGGKVLLASARASRGRLVVHTSTSPADTLWTACIADTSEVTIGDVDSDDHLEIVCAGGSTLLIFENDLSRQPAWTAGLVGTAVGEPLIGDFDGGDDIEIIVGTYLSNGQSLLHILSVPPTPGGLEPVVDPVEVTGRYATGALCDLDGNGSNDIVFATDDGILHRLEYWGTSEPRFEWPMYRHDERNSGLYEQPVAGSLTQSATWSGDMLVRGDVVVPQDATLHLAPGTDVEVAHDWDSTASGRDSMLSELIVEGRLHCVGGCLWPIGFRSDESPALALPDWYGITLEEGAACTLAHVDASDAYKSLWAMAPEALDVQDCGFLGQSMMGLHLEGCGESTALRDCSIDQGAIGVRADSCAAYLGGNTITGAREYGIRLYDDRGSTVEGNDITVGPGTPPEHPPCGIYCSNTFDSVAISILDNVVTMAIEGAYGEGICLYAVPQAAVDVVGNDVTGTGHQDAYTKGIRLGKTAALAHWNRLGDFYYHFYVEPDDDGIPDLGDTSVQDGNGWNATDDSAVYNIYAVAQPPSDPLPAQMNWWGTTRPSGRKFWGVGIDILWEPYLDEDPGAREGQQETGDVALQYRLGQNCPNPFNPLTILTYTIPKESRVRIAVYDLTGRLVRVLCDGMRGTGEHEVSWDGRNGSGQDAGSGVYFCRMEAGSFIESRKLVLLK